MPKGKGSWECQQCYYAHPEPLYDPFYHSTVKSLVSFCATVLIFVRTAFGHHLMVLFVYETASSSLT